MQVQNYRNIKQTNNKDYEQRVNSQIYQCTTYTQNMLIQYKHIVTMLQYLIKLHVIHAHSYIVDVCCFIHVVVCYICSLYINQKIVHHDSCKRIHFFFKVNGALSQDKALE